jgi:hypothetical protein
MSLEIPFYPHVFLSQTGNPINECTIIGKDVVLQVSLDLCDPCIRTDLSFWILCTGVHGVPHDTYDPWRALWNQEHQDHQLQDAGLIPFTWVNSPDRRLLQPSLKDAIWDGSPGGNLCRQIIGYYIFHVRDMVQVMDLKVPFQLLGMEQIGGQLWVLAASFALHLLHDELRITIHEQVSDPKRQGSAQPKNEGLILRHVVGCLEVKVHHILELLPVRIEEQDPCDAPMLMRGAVEEESPVRPGEDRSPGPRLTFIRPPWGVWWWHPVDYEVS